MKKPVECLTYVTYGKARVIPDECVEYETRFGGKYKFPKKEFNYLFHVDSKPDEEGWMQVGALVIARVSDTHDDSMVVFNRHRISVSVMPRESFYTLFREERVRL